MLSFDLNYKHRSALLLILAVLCIGAIPKQPGLSQKPPNKDRAYIMPHEEAQKFVHETLLPALNRIAEHYPIKSLREKFMEFSVAINLHKRVELVLSQAEFDGISAGATSEGKPRLSISLPTIKTRLDMYMKLFDSEKGQAMGDDTLLASFGHEFCHLDKQLVWKLNPSSFSRELKISLESECYDIQCREYDFVMWKHGRPGSGLPICKVHKQVGGNLNDPRWQYAISQLIAPTP